MKTCLAFLVLRSVAAADPVPETLDRAAIAQAMAAVKPDVLACASASQAKGTLKVAVKVAPSGSAEATIVETPAKKLGDCVLVALKKLGFPATEKGGQFRYPYAF